MRRIVVLGIGLLGLAIVAVFRWVPVTRDGAVPADVLPESRADTDSQPTRLASPATFELATPVASASGPSASAEPPPSRQTASNDDRPAISGRVVVEGGLPAEEVTVTAQVFFGAANQRGNSREYEASVAEDGSFTLHVQADARYALLDVEAASLNLVGVVRAEPGAVGVLLKPDRLASIAGRVLPPVGSKLQAETGVGLSCHSRHAQAAADGSFLIHSVPIGFELVVRVKHPFGPEQEVRLAPLLPGERRELVIALESGLTISGSVVDEHGRPVEGVQVWATSQDRKTGGPSSSQRTDSEGHFTFTNLVRQELRIRAGSPEIAREAKVLIDGRSGDALGLVLTVVRGGCIEGTVAWPDGRPAESFSVRAVGTTKHDYETETGEGGRFRICGLEEDVYEIEVSAEGQDMQGVAAVSDAHAGDTSLRLVLAPEPTWCVARRVVARDGRPVRQLKVVGAWR